MKLFISTISFILLTLSLTNPSTVNAQGYCIAGGSCPAGSTDYLCSGGPNNLSDCVDSENDCDGYDCKGYPWCDTGNAATPSCGSYPGCGGSCPAGTCNLGSCTAYTAPAPKPNPTPWPTPRPIEPNCDIDGTCPTPTPDLPPPPPPETYACDCRQGCIPSGSGGTDYGSCSASCVVAPGSPECPDASSVVSTSSCPDIQSSATEDFTFPGQTRTWFTWAPPAGATATERLAGESPTQMMSLSYTSPGDKLTIAFMWRTTSEPHSYYLFDKYDKTFFFFQGANKPPVIFSRKQKVVDNAKKLGYTQIDVNATSPGDAGQIEKRVYKLPDDDGSGDIHPWKDGDGPKFVAHAPWGKSLYHIPFADCASLFNASAHHRYYSTDIAGLKENKYYCFRRKPVQWRFPKDDPDDEYNELRSTGSYLGLINDWPRSSWLADQGESEGTQVWPRQDLFEGSGIYKYISEMGFSMMSNTNGHPSPGFLRAPVMQIPVDVLSEDGEHKLYAYLGMGTVGNSVPVEDENSGGSCVLSNDGDPLEYVHVNTLTGTNPPSCTNFRVTDSNGALATELKIGQQYNVTANAMLDSRLTVFYNSDFDAAENGPLEVKNWRKTIGVTEFQSVICDHDCLTGNTADERVLKMTVSSSSDYVESEYFDTINNLSGKTVVVSFLARSNNTGDRTVPRMAIQRAPYKNTIAPFNEIEDATDTLNLTFPTTGTNVSDQFSVSSSWNRYTGTVTFPADHPLDNESTRLKLRLYGTNNIPIYYDDFKIVSGYKPQVDFKMVPAATPSQEPVFNQCYQSRGAESVAVNDSGALFTGLFNMAKPEYEELPEGNYHIFAVLKTNYGKTFLGNPGVNDLCPAASDTNVWDDSIAEQGCLITLPLKACNETVPVTPSAFIQPPSYSSPTYSVGGVPVVNSITEMTLSNGKLPITVRHSGTNMTHMRLTITKKNPDGTTNTSISPKILTIAKASARRLDGQYYFDFSYTPVENLTNQISISAFALNDDSCVSTTGGLESTALKADVVLMSYSTGRIFEVGRNYLASGSLSCKETYSNYLSLASQPVEDRLNMIDPALVAETAVIPYTYPDSPPYPAPANDPYKVFSNERFKLFTSNSIGYTLPHNPTSSFGWWNRVSSIELQLPTIVSDESYRCASCNKTGDNLSLCSMYSVANANNDGNKFDTDGFSDAHFFLVKGSFDYDSWWQAKGGLVAAIGETAENVYSKLPYINNDLATKCEATITCQPFLSAITSLTSKTRDNTAGILYTNGSVKTNAPNGSVGSWIVQQPFNAYANFIPYTQPPYEKAVNIGDEENYEFFHELIDWSNPNEINEATSWAQLVGTLDAYSNSANTYIFRYPAGSTITVPSDAQLTINGNKKYLIFVDGDLTLNGTANKDLINVEPGSFLMVLAKGNITFTNTIGYDDAYETDDNVEGIFLANKQIIIEAKPTAVPNKSADLKFIGEGSFIGLEGVQLRRYFDHPTDILFREKNSYSPVEQFIFRPDLVMNTPEFLNRPEFTWQETN